MVQSLPMELSSDQTVLLDHASKDSGPLSKSTLNLNWAEERFERAINALLMDGLAWIDDGDQTGNRIYWFPAFVPGLCQLSL